MAHYIEEDFFIEQAVNSDLLPYLGFSHKAIDFVARLFLSHVLLYRNGFIISGEDIFPIEVILKISGDGAKTRFDAVGGNGEQIVVIQPFFSVLCAKIIIPEVGVTPVLPNAIAKRIAYLYIFTFNYTNRQAIDKQNNIGYDAIPGASRCVHPELIDGHKGIALPVLKINDFYQRVLFSGKLVLFEGDFLFADELFKHFPVCFQQG